MSKVTEMVEAEAARAEAEQPDEDEETRGGPADEPGEPGESGPPGEPEVDAEAQAKLLDREMTRHGKALAKILGIEGELQPSNAPGVIGFTLPGVFEYLPHDTFKACPTCNGMGDVLTGSHKMGNETQPCPRCVGRGYLERVKVEQPPPQPVGMVAQPASNGSDEWGVPAWAGDPNIRPGG